MKPAKIEVDLGVLGVFSLKNVEKYDFVDEYDHKVLYMGYYTDPMVLLVAEGEFIPFSRRDALVIPVSTLENYRESMELEE